MYYQEYLEYFHEIDCYILFPIKNYLNVNEQFTTVTFFPSLT